MKSTNTPSSDKNWMLALSPSRYAKQWFDETLFAERVDEAFSTIGQTETNTLNRAFLPISKPLLKEGRKLIKNCFLENNDGALYVGGYSLIMDCLIKRIFDEVTSRFSQEADSPALSLMATGGYGRGELAPRSDIDLLFLTSVQIDKPTSVIVETILYALWDMGLKVGHATRSSRQQIKAVKDDLSTRTSFLEARHLAGDADLSANILNQFKQEVVQGSATSYLKGKLDERSQRLKGINAHRYMLEPNIKNGKGGLRDLHTLFWIARYAYEANNLEDVLSRGILSAGELKEFSQAQQFLWAIRCHLHLRSKRAEDRLTFDAQMDIAPMMGFTNKAGLNSVENFMRRYHLAAKVVGNLTRIFWAAIATDFDTEPREFLRESASAEAPEPFIVETGRINLPDDINLEDHPELIMQVFEIAEKNRLEIHPYILRKIYNNLHIIDDDFRQNPKYNQQFINILTSRQNSERIIRMMNESGFLGEFIPDFGRIVALMQFDMYHSYTVDEHTVFAINVLHNIELGNLADIAPIATVSIKEITLRTELYVAMLLHDIAKGRGGDHSILGAEVARELCPRFGLSEEATETVAWLIEHHLLMSDTAFRYDLSDPITIQNFADKVQSPERLNLLLNLTVSDIRAVGPTVWNGWKAALMRDLHTRTMAVLRGHSSGEILKNVGAGNQMRLKDSLIDTWDKEDVIAHLESFDASYWTDFDDEQYQYHAQLCRQHFASKQHLTLGITPNTKRNATEVVLIADDNIGLFSKFAGSISITNAVIVDARLTTRKDGLTVDVLRIQNTDKQAITDPETIADIEENLQQAHRGALDIDAALDRRLKQTPSRFRRIPIPARVLISNKISDGHTVVEINGKSTPSFLYYITRKMAGFGLQIHTASFTAYGDRVVGIFYINDGFGLKITTRNRMGILHKALLNAIEESDPDQHMTKTS